MIWVRSLTVYGLRTTNRFTWEIPNLNWYFIIPLRKRQNDDDDARSLLVSLSLYTVRSQLLKSVKDAGALYCHKSQRADQHIPLWLFSFNFSFFSCEKKSARFFPSPPFFLNRWRIPPEALSRLLPPLLSHLLLQIAASIEMSQLTPFINHQRPHEPWAQTT